MIKFPIVTDFTLAYIHLEDAVDGGTLLPADVSFYYSYADLLMGAITKIILDQGSIEKAATANEIDFTMYAIKPGFEISGSYILDCNDAGSGNTNLSSDCVEDILVPADDGIVYSCEGF